MPQAIKSIGATKKMKRYSILGGLAVSLLALPAAAQETAYTTTGVTLEAGPASDYPEVVGIAPGAPVNLYGCLDGWTWCDVSYGDARGWVNAEDLAFPYEDQRVPVAVYGPQLSLPVVTFSFGDYWGRYYHDRPFFAERERFERHAPPPPPPHRPPPPPLHRGPEGRPPEHGPADHAPPPHPEPQARPAPAPHPEGHPVPEAHPVEPHPQAVQHPPEPHPQPAARPEARPPEPHPQAAPHPPEQPHPAEEHHEPEQHQ
jgi:uncharacterized protein YraI